jgi:hypothetical protein
VLALPLIFEEAHNLSLPRGSCRSDLRAPQLGRAMQCKHLIYASNHRNHPYPYVGAGLRLSHRRVANTRRSRGGAHYVCDPSRDGRPAGVIRPYAGLKSPLGDPV